MGVALSIPMNLSFASLNLQAWRIPLWVIVLGINNIFRVIKSQPPSLENPFVGTPTVYHLQYIYLCVSTSKPGESLCGNISQKLIQIVVRYSVSTSKPGESLCGLSTVHCPVSRAVPVSTSKPGESLCGYIIPTEYIDLFFE